MAEVKKSPEVFWQEACAKFLLSVASVLTASAAGEADFDAIEEHINEAMTTLRAAESECEDMVTGAAVPDEDEGDGSSDDDDVDEGGSE